MKFEEVPFLNLLSRIVDNRGRTCPTVEKGIPLIATNCVKNSALYPTKEKLRYVSQETHATWFRGHPEPGDMIFVTKGSPGQVCLAPNPVDFCIAQDMVAIRVDESKVYPPFLFALLRSDSVQRQIANMHVGTLIPHFKKGDFDKLVLKIPRDKGFQKKIGDLYLAMSQKIELNRRMNQTLEAIARALFQSWFVDFDPVRTKAEGRDTGLPKHIADLLPDRFVDSELGEIPEGWVVGSLEDLADLNPESWSKKNHPHYVDYMDLANTKNGVIEQVQRFEWDLAPSRARRVLRKNDTIVGTVRPGNRSYAFIASDGLTGSTGFAVLRPKEIFNRHFIYSVAVSDINIERLAHMADGAAYPAVRPEAVSSTGCIIPIENVLKAFDDLVEPLRTACASNEQSSRTLSDLRDTLLPKLLTDEIPVNDVEGIN